MRRTEVFATDEETKAIADLVETARDTPIIATSSAHALDHGGFAGDAWTRVHETVYEYALAHGLPEIEGWYGFHLGDGEFIES
jgi:nicotinamidase-related amidase